MYVSSNNGVTWVAANAGIFAGFCQVFSVAQSPSMIVAEVDGGPTCNGGNPVKSSIDGGVNWTPFMTGLTTGFYSKTGTNSNGTSFFTNAGKKIYRTNSITGIKENNAISEIKTFFDEQNSLNIQLNNNTNLDVKIFSVSGALIYENTFYESVIKINTISNVLPGVYLIMISSGHKLITQKVLKQS